MNFFQLTDAAYNAFIKYGQRDKGWCGQRRLNWRAMNRAQSIRKQLKKYLDRFGIPSTSCEGDHVRLRKCLVSGYFKVSRVAPGVAFLSLFSSNHRLIELECIHSCTVASSQLDPLAWLLTPRTQQK